MVRRYYFHLFVSLWCIFMHLEGTQSEVDVQYVNLDLLSALQMLPRVNVFWDFHSNCTLKCRSLYPLFFCNKIPTDASVCNSIQNRHACCQKFITTTTTPTYSSSTTSGTTPWPSTSTSTTSSTTPWPSSTTEKPLNQLCTSNGEKVCTPEHGCSSSSSSYSHWITPPQHENHLGKCAHKCWEFCSNPCACKTAASGNCEYMPISGGCVARGICREMIFADNECRRKNSYYSVGGVLCYHNKNEVNCEDGVPQFGVNIGGEMYKDQRGIPYTAGREAIYEDDYATKREYNLSITDIKDDNDRDLYGSYALGKGKGQQYFGQCLYYLAGVVEDGRYELSIRTVEPKYEKAGQRLFSIILNNVPLAAHVDISALAGGDLRPVNIVTTLIVQAFSDSQQQMRRRLFIAGYGPVPMTNILRIGLCTSECSMCDEYSQIDAGYVVSGISLVRFGSQK